MKPLEKRRRSNRLISEINVTGFLAVMVVLLYLIMGPYMWVIDGHGGNVDMAKVNHPISMPGARREDAIIVSISKDGKVWFGRQEVELSQLPAKIQDQVRSGSPRVVYLKADARARYSFVDNVLEEVRMSGLEKVAFLVEERKPVKP